MADDILDDRVEEVFDEQVEFEEISSDEVDRVVDALEGLMESVASENIKAFLEEALTNVYFLVYDIVDDESQEAA